MTDLLQERAAVGAERSVREKAIDRFCRIRSASVAMCEPLCPEEYRLQPIDDVSPPWWNLGHTSWFFVRNVLAEFGGQLTSFDEQYDYLLNSYYASLGARLPRDRRGSIARPTTDEIYRYRQSVDARIVDLLATVEQRRLADVLMPLAIGLEHEQQHQELFFTEIKFIRHQCLPPLRARYTSRVPAQGRPGPLSFVEFEGGLFEFGHDGRDWCWDNERPVHRAYLEPFALADRLVTNREYLEFVADDGYRDPLLWLDNGWQAVERGEWRAPLYWERIDGAWHSWTLGGMRLVELDEPVCHVSFYEADAYARWRSQQSSADRSCRLPNEREWERAACHAELVDTPAAFVESGFFHPPIAEGGAGLRQMAGCLWQWTSSYYEPYPGYEPFPGVLAEYNGKFMDNQRVLRGGSCVTPRDHYRHTYRNFWPGPTRFQFTGIRLARSSRI